MYIGGLGSSYNTVREIVFYTAPNNTTIAGTEVMRLTTDQRVGIGHSTADEELDVLGDIKL
jgi:hypothetical protein